MAVQVQSGVGALGGRGTAAPREGAALFFGLSYPEVALFYQSKKSTRRATVNNS